MSPPFGTDEKVQAIHVLNVLDCAKALVAAISQTGGIEKLDIKQVGVRDALVLLFQQASKLQIYEVRAKARGTVEPLDDAVLTEAIQALRKKHVTTADEEELRDRTPEEIEATFSLDAPEGSEPAVVPEPEPDSADPFAI